MKKLVGSKYRIVIIDFSYPSLIPYRLTDDKKDMSIMSFKWWYFSLLMKVCDARGIFRSSLVFLAALICRFFPIPAGS